MRYVHTYQGNEYLYVCMYVCMLYVEQIFVLSKSPDLVGFKSYDGVDPTIYGVTGSHVTFSISLL